MVFIFKASELLEQQLNEVVRWHVKALEPDYDEASDFPSLFQNSIMLILNYGTRKTWHVTRMPQTQRLLQ